MSPRVSRLVLASAFVVLGVSVVILSRGRARSTAIAPGPLAAASVQEPNGAEEALRDAITRRAAQEAIRANALVKAHREAAPTGPLGSCDRAITGMGQTELEALVATTDLSDEAPRWSGPRVRLLEGALASLERLRRDPGRPPGLSWPELTANARALAALPETRFDFQLVIEESLPPTVAGDEFSPGFVKGTLLAYDRTTNTVVCGARLAAAQRADALARLRPRGNAPPWSERDATAVLADDLRSTALRGAAEKLVSLALARR